MTYEEQAREYTRMRRFGEARTEQHIRELAKAANTGRQPFMAAMLLQAEHFPGIMDSRNYQQNMSLTEIRCDLSPQVAGTPEGELIAEIIIRDAYDLARMEQELY